METFHLLHLAACWTGRTVASRLASSGIPLTTGPVVPVIAQPQNLTQQQQPPAAPPSLPNTVIRAAAVHMVFASRKSRDFITPQQVQELEYWTGLVSTSYASGPVSDAHSIVELTCLSASFFFHLAGGFKRIDEHRDLGECESYFYNPNNIFRSFMSLSWLEACPRGPRQRLGTPRVGIPLVPN